MPCSYKYFDMCLTERLPVGHWNHVIFHIYSWLLKQELANHFMQVETHETIWSGASILCGPFVPWVWRYLWPPHPPQGYLWPLHQNVLFSTCKKLEITLRAKTDTESLEEGDVRLQVWLSTWADAVLLLPPRKLFIASARGLGANFRAWEPVTWRVPMWLQNQHLSAVRLTTRGNNVYQHGCWLIFLPRMLE